LYRAILRAKRNITGKSEKNEAEERIVSGKTWDEFCDTLKSSGSSVMGMGSPQDPFTQAEGYRYLTRLLRAGLEAFVEYNDAKAPVLRRMAHETVKMGADNPDNYYQNAVISGEYEYRIHGSRGTIPFLAISTHEGTYGDGSGLPTTGFLNTTELKTNPDGTFEVVLSCKDRSKEYLNWLPMTPKTGMVIVRQTFADREKEEIADITIERIDGDGLPSPLTAESIDRGLSTASAMVAGASVLFSKWARDFQKHTNQLPQFDPEVSNRAGGDPDIAYYHSYWKLGPEEVLVIEAAPPACEHWNFQLNDHWMESLDYRYYRIHINKHTARYREDGSFRIVVAHEDPGVENWIQTVGHDRGTMCFRWVKAEAHPQPKTEVLTIKEFKRRVREEKHGV
jgi:hypothetical protein